MNLLPMYKTSHMAEGEMRVVMWTPTRLIVETKEDLAVTAKAIADKVDTIAQPTSIVPNAEVALEKGVTWKNIEEGKTAIVDPARGGSNLGVVATVSKKAKVLVHFPIAETDTTSVEGVTEKQTIGEADIRTTVRGGVLIATGSLETVSIGGQIGIPT
mmetsp:Transcript_35828/g.55726  ORF Transcript_35828/g.55726 Transcript_35828/m.55726 type:complete len:158 (+) Transcript_35828:1984-2457(+)